MSTNNPTEQTERRPFSKQDYNNILGAVAKLQELQAATGLITPANPGTNAIAAEAEAKGLIEFLSSQLVGHVFELLECWKIVQTEYSPLVGVLTTVAKRVTANLAPKSPVS